MVWCGGHTQYIVMQSTQPPYLRIFTLSLLLITLPVHLTPFTLISFQGVCTTAYPFTSSHNITPSTMTPYTLHRSPLI